VIPTTSPFFAFSLTSFVAESLSVISEMAWSVSPSPGVVPSALIIVIVKVAFDVLPSVLVATTFTE